MIRIIILGCSSALAAGLLFVNVYTSAVDAVSWGAALPESITVAREYFKAVNPGTFFRIISPVNQLLAVIAVIACWKMGRARYLALAALALTVATDLFTFGYFYPRNEIMFVAPYEASGENIRLAWEQWSTMNWLRSGICLADTIFAMSAMIVISRKTAL
jgi:hypothetical protein